MKTITYLQYAIYQALKTCQVSLYFQKEKKRKIHSRVPKLFLERNVFKNNAKVITALELQRARDLEKEQGSSLTLAKRWLCLLQEGKVPSQSRAE
jgi:hypothetical protein